MRLKWTWLVEMVFAAWEALKKIASALLPVPLPLKVLLRMSLFCGPRAAAGVPKLGVSGEREVGAPGLDAVGRVVAEVVVADRAGVCAERGRGQLPEGARAEVQA